MTIDCKKRRCECACTHFFIRHILFDVGNVCYVWRWLTHSIRLHIINIKKKKEILMIFINSNQKKQWMIYDYSSATWIENWLRKFHSRFQLNKLLWAAVFCITMLHCVLAFATRTQAVTMLNCTINLCTRRKGKDRKKKCKQCFVTRHSSSFIR